MNYQFSQETINRVIKQQYDISREEQVNNMSLQQSTPPPAAPRIKEPVYSMNKAAKMLGIGPNKLFKLLREKHIIDASYNYNYPYQRYIDAGYFKTKTKSRIQKGVGQVFYATTQVTNKGIEWLTKKLQQWEES